MSNVVICCDGLSKKYHRGAVQNRNTLLRDQLARMLKSPLSAFRRSQEETFWALKDVCLEIREGEVLGLIGGNGAGKSTLLKVLSRITKPTSGWAEIHGRVGSLLEVGTGFHPELTGRENVFLNGAILGMRKAEIEAKFDEIVAFAEIERFIDTPVKHYSSGMHVRLAFAVAAYLEPEILFVDEVLAVGDVAFQKKCLGKMGDVAKHGRTVLFVSHNMNAIEQLCKRVILLESGLVKIDSAAVRSVVNTYICGASEEDSKSAWVNNGNAFCNPYFRPIRIAIVDSCGNELAMPVRNDAEIWVEIEGEIATPHPALTIGYGMFDETRQLLYWTCHTDQREADWPVIKRGRIHLRGKIPSRLLNEGNYRLEFLASLHFNEWLLQPGSGSSPHVVLSIQGGLSDSPYWMMKRPGVLAPLVCWREVGQLTTSLTDDADYS